MDGKDLIKLKGLLRLKDLPSDPSQVEETQERSAQIQAISDSIQKDLRYVDGIRSSLLRQHAGLRHALGGTSFPENRDPKKIISGEELSLLLFALLKMKPALTAAEACDFVRTIGKEVGGKVPATVIGSAIRRLRAGYDPRFPKRKSRTFSSEQQAFAPPPQR
jgi:hypothetical protein